MKAIAKWVLLVVVAGFFLLAGVLKLADPVEFARSILRYRLAGEQLSWLVALWLPWIEIGAASVLLPGTWRRAGLILLFGLLLAFQLALASAAVRGLDIDCGCLGGAVPTSIGFALLRNFLLMAAILAVPWLERRSA